MNNLLSRIMAVVVVLFLLGACSKGNAASIGENAPDFTLTDINGKQVSLMDFKGQVVILNFFASWCPPCRQEIPDFIELQKQYGDQGFSVVGVALVSLEDAKSFAAKTKINYTILVDDGKVSGIYGPIRSIPTTFIIGRDSRIAKMYIGARTKDVFEKDIKELLK